MQNYDWGSRTALPDLCGIASPSAAPIAELWYGAHEMGSSTFLDGQRLDAQIARNPINELGENFAEVNDGRLPFLVKLLSAERPLSLQVHPSLSQAKSGFSREESNGVPMDSPKRNYKDWNHKPETLVALSEFSALAGFRETQDTLNFLKSIRSPRLHGTINTLADAPGPSGIASAFNSIYQLTGDELKSTVLATAEAASQYLKTAGPSAPWSKESKLMISLAKEHPNDPGSLASVLLNLVVLQPGQAIFLKPGQLHAYLCGTGIEVMSSSDNVIRCGLTTKHVDLEELRTIITFDPTTDPMIIPHHNGRNGGIELIYPTPGYEFKLSRIELGTRAQSYKYTPNSPEILVCTSGLAQAHQSGDMVPVGPGQAIWIPMSSEEVLLSSTSDATLFRTRAT
ncbi:mannose-6-phosphate isomerase, class I [Dietzia kunjamensis]|nr:mannose-6-phosphate isomerase, class I [Dietzia kunjamensis]